VQKNSNTEMNSNVYGTLKVSFK